MSVTQYIGARYVPLFATPEQWSSERAYEPLTIVLNEGNSYTSKQAVPIGIDIQNNEFWALTGNYNAQVEAYRREVEHFAGQIDEAVEKADEALTGVTEEAQAREAADNELKELIENNAQVAETVADFESATYKLGSVVLTKGFAAVNDMGGAVYYIVNAVPEGYEIGIDAFSNGENFAILKRSETINIAKLGAFPENDITAALQHAVNTHKKVELNSGIYEISSAIEIPADTAISGYNHQTIINSYESDCFHLLGRFIEISNIVFYGAPSGGGYATSRQGTCILIPPNPNATRIYLHDIWINRYINAIITPNEDDVMWHNTFRNMRIGDCTLGVRIKSGSSFGNLFEQVYFDACTKAVEIEGDRGSNFINCNFGVRNNCFPCIEMTSSQILFEGCNFECDEPINGNGQFILIHGLGATLLNCKSNTVGNSHIPILDFSQEVNCSSVIVQNFYGLLGSSGSTQTRLYNPEFANAKRNLLMITGELYGVSLPTPTSPNGVFNITRSGKTFLYQSGGGGSAEIITKLQQLGSGTLAYDLSRNKLQCVISNVLTDIT